MNERTSYSRGRLGELILEDSSARRSILIISSVQTGVTSAILEPVSRLARSALCLWVTTTRVEAEQVSRRLIESDVSVFSPRSSLDVRMMRNKLVHAQQEIPLMIVMTAALLGGHNTEDLAAILPQPRAVVLGTGVGERASRHGLVESARDLIRIESTVLGLALEMEAGGRQEIIVDLRPSVGHIADLIRFEIVRYSRTAAERDFLGALPPRYASVAESSRGALRQVLESAAESLDLQQDEDGDLRRELAATEAEELLERLDDLPSDPRIQAIAEIVEQQSGLVLLPLRRQRSIQYFGAAMREALGGDRVSVEGDQFDGSTQLMVAGLANLGRLPWDFRASVWLEFPRTLDGFVNRLHVLRDKPHTVYIVAPADASEAERQIVENTAAALEAIPEVLGNPLLSDN